MLKNYLRVVVFALLTPILTQAQTYDAGYVRPQNSNPYYATPLSQIEPVSFTGFYSNTGTGTVTGAKMYVTIPSLYSDSSTNYSIPSGDTIPLSITNTFTPPSTVASYTATYNITVTQPEVSIANNTGNHIFTYTDSVYARDPGVFNGGLGFNGGTGLFGQYFSFNQTDTLTAMSVFLNSPTAGDSIRFVLFNYSGGVPTNPIDTSDVMVIPSSTPNWYTIAFPCDVELTPGEYFFAAEQINTNNLGFGYSQSYYEPGALHYSSNGGLSWTDFESAGFNASLGLRLVLGNPTGGVFNYDIGNDTTICPSQPLTVDASQLDASYVWSTNETTPAIDVSQQGTYYVTVSKCGVSSVDSIVIDVTPPADVNLGADIDYCESDGIYHPIYLTGTPGASYTWSGGVSGNNYTVTSPGTYIVQGTYLGCTTYDTLVVTEHESLTALDLGSDVFYCDSEGLNLEVNATNVPAASYVWNDGATDSLRYLTSAGVYVVTVSQSGVCVESLVDTLVVTEVETPVVALNDTFYCTGSYLELDPGSGYLNYIWSEGSTTPTINVNTQGTYSVTVSNGHGCNDTAQAQVGWKQGVIVNLGNDTNYWQAITLNAGSGYGSYLWSTGETSQMITANSTGSYWVEVGSGDGCFDRDTIEVTLRLGVDDLSQSNVSIFPVPNDGNFNLRLDGESKTFEVSIYSIAGNVVYQKELTLTDGESTPIQLQNAVSGNYIIQLKSDDKVVQQPFIVR